MNTWRMFTSALLPVAKQRRSPTPGLWTVIGLWDSWYQVTERKNKKTFFLIIFII